MKLVIATEYTKTPGARYIKEGQNSGEDFRLNYLEPKFNEALNRGETLLVDLDGGYGYPPSFLDEAFGVLARKYGAKKVWDVIRLKSDDEPRLIDKIVKYVSEADEKGR